MSEPLSIVPRVSDSDRVAAVFEELRHRRDPKRAAAEHAEREILVAKYPGQYVAYLDVWDGERLARTVIANGFSIADVHAQLGARPDLEAIRHTMTVTQIDDPDEDAIGVPWFTIASVEEHAPPFFAPPDRLMVW